MRGGVVFPETGASWVDREFETLPTRAQDRFGTGEQRSSGREDIIDQQQMAPFQPFGMLDGEDPFDIVPPFFPPAMRLRRVVPDAAETAAFDRYLQRPGDPVGQILRLVVAARQPFAPMQRHGDYPVNRGIERTFTQAMAVPYAHVACQPPRLEVFEAMNQAAPAAARKKIEKSRRLLDRQVRRQPFPQRIVAFVAESGKGDLVTAAGADDVVTGPHLSAADRTAFGIEQASDTCDKVIEDRHRN